MESLDYKEALTLHERYPKLFKKQEAEVNGQKLELFDYFYADWKVFQSHKSSRNLRGVVFDPATRNIVSLPFHKFFNVNENEETVEENLTFIGRMFDKQDGSLAQVTSHNGNLLVASRSSLTGYVAKAVKPLLENKYPEIVEYVLRHPATTFLFEYLDPRNPIVLVPGKEELVFLNARDKYTGAYEWDRHITEIPCKTTPVHKLEDGMWQRVKQGLTNTKNFEGFVLDIPSGLYKVKTAWYMDAHKIVTGNSPKSYVLYWAEGKLDDVMASLNNIGHADEMKRVQSTIDAMDNVLDEKITEMLDVAQRMETPKELAIYLNSKLMRDSLDKMLMGFVMRHYRENNLVYGEVYNSFRESLVGQDSRAGRIVELVEGLP